MWKLVYLFILLVDVFVYVDVFRGGYVVIFNWVVEWRGGCNLNSFCEEKNVNIFFEDWSSYVRKVL